MSSGRMDRRTAIKLGLMTAAGSMLPIGCGGSGSNGPSPLALPKVDVAENRIVKLIAGLRPFRKSGFVVRSEIIGSKTIIHNYGHGGCGVSLSWGTSKLAVDLTPPETGRVAVLGCGAVGLATARLLQDQGHHVTIYARDLPPNTTSNVAGAIWGPITIDSPGFRSPEYVAQLQAACRFAWSYFQTLIGERYGIRWVRLFLVDSDPIELPWAYAGISDLTRLTPLSAAENPFPRKYAASFYTMMIDSNAYLNALEGDFLAHGGEFVVGELDLAAVLALPELVVFNCTGLGAKALFGDAELEPIKGQLTLLLPQPEIEYGYVDGRNDLYMFPRQDGIVLGGSHEEGNFDVHPDPAQAQRIFDGQRALFCQMA